MNDCKWRKPSEVNFIGDYVIRYPGGGTYVINFNELWEKQLQTEGLTVPIWQGCIFFGPLPEYKESI